MFTATYILRHAHRAITYSELEELLIFLFEWEAQPLSLGIKAPYDLFTVLFFFSRHNTILRGKVCQF